MRSLWTFVAVAAAVLALGAEAETWAVLVAGSNTYANYRHQADVYNAYQILHMNGIPDSHIIVFVRRFVPSPIRRLPSEPDSDVAPTVRPLGLR